jgi:ABC-2 type transport system permease protein
MNLRRTMALVKRYLWLSFRIKWRAIEMIYFPLISLLMWGFLTLVAQGDTLEFAFMMLGVQLIWSFAFQAQNNFNIFMMEDIWNNCFKEILNSPITGFELLVSKFIAATMRSLVTLVFLLIAAVLLFGFNLVQIDLLIFLTFVFATLIAATGLGIFIDAMVVELGKEFGFLAWASTQLFIMISCPYYPINAFPDFLHPLIQIAPFYWIFDGVKQHLLQPQVDVSQQVYFSLIVGFVYLVLSIPLFTYFVNKSKRTGKLARM